jgi:hypothetical protein
VLACVVAGLVDAAAGLDVVLDELPQPASIAAAASAARVGRIGMSAVNRSDC